VEGYRKLKVGDRMNMVDGARYIAEIPNSPAVALHKVCVVDENEMSGIVDAAVAVLAEVVEQRVANLASSVELWEE